MTHRSLAPELKMWGEPSNSASKILSPRAGGLRLRPVRSWVGSPLPFSSVILALATASAPEFLTVRALPMLVHSGAGVRGLLAATVGGTARSYFNAKSFACAVHFGVRFIVRQSFVPYLLFALAAFAGVRTITANSNNNFNNTN